MSAPTREEALALCAAAERDHAALPGGPWWRNTCEDGEDGEGQTGVYPGSRGLMVETNDVVAPPPDGHDYPEEIASCNTPAIAVFLANARTREPLLVAALREQMRATAAAEREADRLRHGVPVEGDYVCPDALRADAAEQRATAAEAEAAELRGTVRALRERATAAEAARVALVERHEQAERELHQAVAKQKARAEKAEAETTRLRALLADELERVAARHDARRSELDKAAQAEEDAHNRTRAEMAAIAASRQAGAAEALFRAAANIRAALATMAKDGKP